jgi:peptidyl-tRNA hydrolase, PTH2 family
MNVKQVIVIRRDLKMRRGKEIAQGAHAAMIWLTERLSPVYPGSPAFTAGFTPAELKWVKGNFRKIVCQTSSLEDLMKIQQAADDAGVMSRLVYDAGLTEFDGIETVTALAIGPDYDDKIDEVTKDLRLY